VPAPRLLDALKTHLISQGLVRDPRTAGVLPPFWRQPRLGTPAPGETPSGGSSVEAGDPVAAAFISGGFPIGRFESAWRRPTVEVRVRASKAPTAEDLCESIIAATIDRTNWTMGNRLIIESQMWRPLTPAGSDEQGFDYLFAIAFEIYAPQ
jgi:hypothetical protein